MTHTGPPDSMREHVVAAAHAMLKGDWKKCRDYILSIKALDLFLNVDQLKEMLTRYVVSHETYASFVANSTSKGGGGTTPGPLSGTKKPFHHNILYAQKS